MRIHRAGRGLAAASIAALCVLGIPATASAAPPPGGSPTPTTNPCLPSAAPPVADLGDVPPWVVRPNQVHVVADQSTGVIVHQALRVDQGTQLWGIVSWDGPPGPDHWVSFGFVPGVYTLTLTVTDCLGRTDSVAQQVRVYDIQIHDVPILP